MAVQYQFRSVPVAAVPPLLPEEERAMLHYFLGRHVVLPQAEAPEVSIIIPVFNQYRYTIACLQSLLTACAGKTSYEVILADDASTDETREIGKVVENLRIVVNASGQRGFLPNVNFAAKSARGKYLFLLNNDTLLLDDGGLLDRMTAHFRRGDVGAVGCHLLRADGSLYDCGRLVLSDGCLMNLSPTNGAMQNAYLESDLVEGSAMMVSAAAWRDFGGFDPVYGRGYFEESDFCFRLKVEKKLRIITDLGSHIIHFGQRSFQDGSDKKSLFEQNAGIFFRRWHEYLVGREAGLPSGDASVRALALWEKFYQQ